MTGARAMVREPVGAALAGATALFIAVWLAFPVSGFWRVAAEDWIWAAVSSLAAVAAFVAARRPENRELRRAFLFLGAGSLAWTFGQLVWTVYEVVLREPVPAVSMADAGYLAALPLLAAGVLAWPRRERRLTGGDVFDVAFLAGVLALASLEFVIGPLVEAGLDGYGGWLRLAYPVGDVALFAVVAGGLLIDGRQQRSRLALIAAGLLSLAAADTAFELGVTSSAFDLGWTVPFTCIGLAALLPREWRPAPGLRIPRSACGLLAAGLLAALGAYKIAERWPRQRTVDRVDFVAVFALMLLLAARFAGLARTRAREAGRERVAAQLADPALHDLDEEALASELLARCVRLADASDGGLHLRGGRRGTLRLAAGTPLAGGDSEVVPLLDGGESIGELRLVRARDAETVRIIATLLPRHLALARARGDLRRAYVSRDAAVEASRTGVCLFAEDGSALLWNSAFRRLLGDGCPFTLDWPSVSDWIRHSVPTALRPGEEVRFWTAEQRFLSVRAALAGAELLVSIDDMTDAERERETRNRFVAEIVDAQDRESRRIADLLHDDAVQQLTALGLRLGLAAQRSGDGSLADMAAAANGITATVRRLLVDLHPAVLESQGLAAAIDSAAAGLRAQGLAVAVDALDERFAGHTEHLVYRLVLEAFANAGKHAGASRVEVELAREGETLRCRISDDGVGFEVAGMTTALAEGHVGLHLLRERVEIVGGRFEIESQRGAGTRLSFEIPVPSTINQLQEAIR